MKQKLSLKLFIGSLLFSVFSYSQSSPNIAIEYSYDGAGNRIQRKVITLGGENPSSLQQANTAGITDLKGSYTFNLFPNPTTNRITIQTDEAFQNATDKRLLVTDLNGKVIIDKPFLARTEEIDLSIQASGEYLVKVFASGNVAEWKVVKVGQ